MCIRDRPAIPFAHFGASRFASRVTAGVICDRSKECSERASLPIFDRSKECRERASLPSFAHWSEY
eukprot:7116059-Prymnesium_polylepis.1